MKASSSFCRIGVAAVCLNVLAGIAPSAFAAPAARVSLFDGKTLKGWTVLKCEAVVQDGNILLQAGNGLVQTGKKYGDFVFECEWKALKPEKWDSGIYFRYETLPPNRPWPLKYQVNLRQGEEGALVGNKATIGKGQFKDREWNQLKLTVRGTKASLEVNGKLAWEADGLEGPQTGYIALQSEVPGGGQHLFRRIFVTEL